MIPLATPLLGDEEAAAVADVLASGWLVQGERVAEFERRLSPWIGDRAVVACSSGTAALNLALAALDLPAGSKVAVPSFTFPATINSVLLAGLVPVLIDTDPATWNFDADDAAEVLRCERPAALLAVHQFGSPAPLDRLMPLCAELGVTVVEDAACALGATQVIDGVVTACGAIGVLGCFSFHPRKILTTGEGGCVSTADPDLDRRLRLLRNHGMERAESGVTFLQAGWNFRLTEMQGAMGVVQMDRLETLLADRRRLADGYRARLDGSPIGLPEVPPGSVATWQSYVVRLPRGIDRAAVIASMADRGVAVSIGAQALHHQPAYRDLPGCQRALPGTDEAFDRQLALPVAWGLGDVDLDAICGGLLGCVAGGVSSRIAAE